MTAAGSASQRPFGAPREALLAALQRIIVGVLLMTILTIRIDWFSTGVIGAAILSWAAVRTRSVCAGTSARWWWVVTSLLAAGAGVWGLIAPKTQSGALLVQVVNVVVAASVISAMAATGSDQGWSTTARWRRLVWMAWPAVTAFAAVAVLLVGRGDGSGRDSDATTRIGDLHLALPGWAWAVTIVGLVPLLVVIVGAVVAFAGTYREVAGRRGGGVPRGGVPSAEGS